jgi:hypothetical protein
MATRGRSLLLRSSQLRLGAGTSATSAHGHREATAAHALCTPTVATAPRIAARSSSSRSTSASGAEQTSKDCSPPRRRPGKERVNDGDVAARERDLGYQSPEQVLKDILTGDSNSGDDNDRRKKLYAMYGGSWELTFRRNVKSLRREVLSATPGVLRAAPHQRWWSTTSTFGASDFPENMAGAGILPLITAPVIANIKLHHVLIDGGPGLNVISHTAFR